MRSSATHRLYSRYSTAKNERRLVDLLHTFPTTLMEIRILGYIQYGPDLYIYYSPVALSHRYHDTAPANNGQC
jgi:hypothetical protein